MNPFKRRGASDGSDRRGTESGEGGAAERTSPYARSALAAVESEYAAIARLKAEYARAAASGTAAAAPEPVVEPEPEPPVITSPFVGFRVWTVAEGPYPFLSGYADSRWKPGKNVATCAKTRGAYGRIHALYEMNLYSTRGRPRPPEPVPCESVPALRCGCGFWASSDPDQVLWERTSGTVMGAIIGWGKVIPGETGFRSEFATIAGLFAPAGEYRGIENLYGVPLLVTLDKLVETAEHLAGWMAGEDLANPSASRESQGRDAE